MVDQHGGGVGSEGLVRNHIECTQKIHGQYADPRSTPMFPVHSLTDLWPPSDWLRLRNIIAAESTKLFILDFPHSPALVRAISFPDFP